MINYETVFEDYECKCKLARKINSPVTLHDKYRGLRWVCRTNDAHEVRLPLFIEKPELKRKENNQASSCIRDPGIH